MTMSGGGGEVHAGEVGAGEVGPGEVGPGQIAHPVGVARVAGVAAGVVVAATERE
jgi:hypothetical protein